MSTIRAEIFEGDVIIKKSNAALSLNIIGNSSPVERSGCHFRVAEKQHNRMDRPAVVKQYHSCGCTSHFAACCFIMEESNKEDPYIY